MATEVKDRRIERHPVWRVEFDQMSWASTESAVDSAAIQVSGILYAHAVTVNDNDNNRTVTLSILDEDSVTLYSLGAIAENATTVTRLTAGTEVYMPEGCTLTILPSGAPGASGMTVTVRLYGA